MPKVKNDHNLLITLADKFSQTPPPTYKSEVSVLQQIDGIGNCRFWENRLGAELLYSTHICKGKNIHVMKKFKNYSKKD
jgi:hypothetical protein